MVSLAIRMASASSSNGITTATGPKISSCTARWSSGTGHSTVGGNQYPGPSGAWPRIATCAPPSTNAETVSRWLGRDQRPHLGRLVERVADADRPHRPLEVREESSTAGRCDQDARARAAVLAGVVEHRARARRSAAASTSASAKTTLADLPPSSSVTRLIVAAAPAAIERPTSVEPVNAIFATSGCSTSRAPHSRPGPTTTLTTPSGSPASSASSREAQRGQRRQLGRLEHHGVAGRQRRAPSSSRRSPAGSSTA